jgi:hypothetical protein
MGAPWNTRRGRPPLPPEARKDARRSVRLSDVDEAALEAVKSRLKVDDDAVAIRAAIHLAARGAQ